MNILVDAHIGRLIVGFLESLGNHVLRASSFPPRTSDVEILDVAHRENRIVMTSDKDFGELVFRGQKPAAGVILLRIDVETEAERLAVIEKFWTKIEAATPGHFVVVTRTTVRRTPLP